VFTKFDNDRQEIQMYKTLTAIRFGLILLGLAFAANAQVDSRRSSEPSAVSEYETFLKRTDTVLVTQSFPLTDVLGRGGHGPTAKISWVFGDAKKLYALDIYDQVVDFNKLESIEDGLDKLYQAVNTSFETTKASSMSYSSPFGIYANYYSFTVNGKSQKNLYLVIGSYISQSPTAEPLARLRDVIEQGRQKLIELGAK
jgi:hypothetical protein